jgi:hypothetical protein
MIHEKAGEVFELLFDLNRLFKSTKEMGKLN